MTFKELQGALVALAFSSSIVFGVAIFSIILDKAFEFLRQGMWVHFIACVAFDAFVLSFSFIISLTIGSKFKK